MRKLGIKKKHRDQRIRTKPSVLSLVGHWFGSPFQNRFDSQFGQKPTKTKLISTLVAKLVVYVYCLAVETSRRQLQACKTIEPELAAPSQAKPVLEEFMPLKNSTPAAEDDEKPPTTIMSDKANWMTSVQLWSQANDVVTKHQPTPNNNDPSKLQDSNNNSDTCNQGINNGAFVPFNKDRSSVVGGGEKGVTAEMELLEKCENKNNDNNNNIDGGRIMENGAAEVGLTPTTTTNSTTSHTHRKARRCWSPDLHRRFVNALQMLGGSQGIYILYA